MLTGRRHNTNACWLKSPQHPLPSTGQFTGSKDLHPDHAHSQRNLRGKESGREGLAGLFHQGDRAGLAAPGMRHCQSAPWGQPSSQSSAEGGSSTTCLSVCLTSLILVPPSCWQIRSSPATENMYWTEQPPSPKPQPLSMI